MRASPNRVGLCLLVVLGLGGCEASTSPQTQSTTRPSSTPRAPGVPALDKDPIAEIAAGDGFTCNRRRSGRVQCWGSGASGQLGDGASTDRGTPAALVQRLDDATSLSLGRAHACALRKTGRVSCWGNNDAGPVSYTHLTLPTTPYV